jgi:hypothetical protein
MEDKSEISSIEELKLFMQQIEPQIENLLKSFYNLKEFADKKIDTDALMEKLELQFQELSETQKLYKSTNKRINDFLNSVDDFTKRDVIHNGSMTRNQNLDFFKLMNEFSKNNSFNYGCWGKMNKRIQQLYLRMYSYYSKSIYELIKIELKNKN